MLRNGKGEMKKIERRSFKDLLITTDSGFELFRTLDGDHLIESSILTPETRRLLLSQGGLNVKAIDARGVDQFIEQKMG